MKNNAERETFLAMLFTSPRITPSDALIVLLGEDAVPRMELARQLLTARVAPYLLLSGGLDDPPRRIGADRAASMLGLPDSCLVIENESQNTHEQAEYATRIIQERGWKRVILVASAYHMPRAFLTFVHALGVAELSDKVNIVACASAQSRWADPPSGVTASRADLFLTEREKTFRYRAMGDVATEETAIEYLKWWEGK
jgi:hypothetical protein